MELRSIVHDTAGRHASTTTSDCDGGQGEGGAASEAVVHTLPRLYTVLPTVDVDADVFSLTSDVVGSTSDFTVVPLEVSTSAPPEPFELSATFDDTPHTLVRTPVTTQLMRFTEWKCMLANINQAICENFECVHVHTHTHTLLTHGTHSCIHMRRAHITNAFIPTHPQVPDGVPAFGSDTLRTLLLRSTKLELAGRLSEVMMERFRTHHLLDGWMDVVEVLQHDVIERVFGWPRTTPQHRKVLEWHRNASLIFPKVPEFSELPVQVSSNIPSIWNVFVCVLVPMRIDHVQNMFTDMLSFLCLSLASPSDSYVHFHMS